MKRKRKKKEKLNNPHDLIFRCVFSDPVYAADLIKNYGGTTLRKAIRWSELKHLSTHKFGDQLDEYINDGVFIAPLIGSDSNEMALTILEHKSYLDPALLIQFGKYLFLEWDSCLGSDDWLDNQKLPSPVLVLLYHGPKPYKPFMLKDIVARIPGLERLIPHIEIIVIDLTQLKIADLKGKPLTRATLESMIRASKKTLLEGLPGILGHFRGESNTSALQRKLLILLRYADSIQKLSKEIILDAIKQVFEKKGESMAATLFEELRLEGETRGEAKGRAKGRVEGRVEGEAKGVIKVLETRFDSVPKTIRNAVTACNDPDKLDAMIRRAVKCASINEFKQCLR